ncbi:MAG TPA: YbhB/YbcL family Raf kinase inhibitor-like protein [Egibacteraceae bacterium]|nr:YbhB/YbcL family Raf kinase inhibitor-like protein [Egibacteraceae bacterium]
MNEVIGMAGARSWLASAACAALLLVAAGCDQGGQDIAESSPADQTARQEPATAEATGEPAPAVDLDVSSDAFAEGEEIPARHTCDGETAPLPLRWEGVPDQAVELALRMDDPDAPGGTFTHWTMTGIGPLATGLEEGEIPAGAVQGSGDTGQVGYFGPCPPPGDDPHRYVITVYALRAPIVLSGGFAPSELDQALEQSGVIAEGTLTGVYGR